MAIHPAPAAPGVKVVLPGEGRTGGLAPGVGVVFKIEAADTGGALSIVEHPFPVGALVPRTCTPGRIVSPLYVARLRIPSGKVSSYCTI